MRVVTTFICSLDDDFNVFANLLFEDLKSGLLLDPIDGINRIKINLYVIEANFVRSLALLLYHARDNVFFETVLINVMICDGIKFLCNDTLDFIF